MAQTLQELEIVVVDNSGAGRVRKMLPGDVKISIIEMPNNVGFGAALNAVFAQSRAPYLATLNDDAVATPEWLEHLVGAMASDPKLGSCASAVQLKGQNVIDSAGMLIASDGSSKQRGHGEPTSTMRENAPALMPSGSAAIYRREMFAETGGFDNSFFLYCEDSDLGLRARWAGWDCQYVAAAVVEHHYSHSAGKASGMKAYLVERNRLRLIIKNFPMRELLLAPLGTLARYYWHATGMLRGVGKASEFRKEGNSALVLVGIALRAHRALIPELPRLWLERRQIRRAARISVGQFRSLMRCNSISLRGVAEQ